MGFQKYIIHKSKKMLKWNLIGLGKEYALAYAERGAKVVGKCINHENKIVL